MAYQKYGITAGLAYTHDYAKAFQMRLGMADMMRQQAEMDATKKRESAEWFAASTARAKTLDPFNEARYQDILFNKFEGGDGLLVRAQKLLDHYGSPEAIMANPQANAQLKEIGRLIMDNDIINDATEFKNNYEAVAKYAQTPGQGTDSNVVKYMEEAQKYQAYDPKVNNPYEAREVPKFRPVQFDSYAVYNKILDKSYEEPKGEVTDWVNGQAIYQVSRTFSPAKALQASQAYLSLDAGARQFMTAGYVEGVKNGTTLAKSPAEYMAQTVEAMSTNKEIIQTLSVSSGNRSDDASSSFKIDPNDPSLRNYPIAELLTSGPEVSGPNNRGTNPNLHFLTPSVEITGDANRYRLNDNADIGLVVTGKDKFVQSMRLHNKTIGGTNPSWEIIPSHKEIMYDEKNGVNDYYIVSTIQPYVKNEKDLGLYGISKKTEAGTDENGDPITKTFYKFNQGKSLSIYQDYMELFGLNPDQEYSAQELNDKTNGAIQIKTVSYEFLPGYGTTADIPTFKIITRMNRSGFQAYNQASWSNMSVGMQTAKESWWEKDKPYYESFERTSAGIEGYDKITPADVQQIQEQLPDFATTDFVKKSYNAFTRSGKKSYGAYLDHIVTTLKTGTDAEFNALINEINGQ